MKRPPLPETTIDPLFEALVTEVKDLRKRVAYLEDRLAVNRSQRNCPRCGRMATRATKTCGVCGESMTPPETK